MTYKKATAPPFGSSRFLFCAVLIIDFRILFLSCHIQNDEDDKGKKQNTMTDKHIDEILDLYKKRETVDKEAYLASFEDIEKNDFNLNIPRYVDNFEQEEQIDINTLLADMKKTDDEIEKVQGEFLSLLKNLTSEDENIKASLNNIISMIEG